ncbi:MAG TPA: 50S ribosomal protein L5 [Candidatus Saccharimonadales bacterium]|jgi:large subunit ribosomal protein L5|nr:50S ribosomal protein L5 [Candidatus Saccharimonadales bacterium]
MATATTKTAAKAPKTFKQTTTVRLREQYNATIAAELKKELELGNPHQVPKLVKITVNVGLGKAKDDKKIIEAAKNTLRKITGQNPVETIAKKSIASFKLREGNMIGLKVTLRGDKMYEFMDRLITIVLPRLRDFHGVSNKAFDRQGNFSLGLIDQSVFPELSFDETTTAHGLQAVFTINCEKPEHAKVLLQKFGMPFEKEAK